MCSTLKEERIQKLRHQDVCLLTSMAGKRDKILYDYLIDWFV